LPEMETWRGVCSNDLNANDKVVLSFGANRP
jgi:hypothetical protein